MKTILVTAFEPFGGESINPTELILSALPNEIGGTAVTKLLLPVEFLRAPSLAAEAIDRVSPSAVLMLGQAGGRAAVTPERVAINVMDASMPDNAGFMPNDESIAPEGPAAYFASLPIKRMVTELKANGLPALVSNSAGTYVCNSLMYGVLRHIAERGLGIPAGFVHFPYIPEQLEGKEPKPPAIELTDGIKAARIMLAIIAETVNSL